MCDPKFSHDLHLHTVYLSTKFHFDDLVLTKNIVWKHITIEEMCDLDLGLGEENYNRNPIFYIIYLHTVSLYEMRTNDIV